MDIVLGVSLTPKTVRMVLVEGIQGDGAIVDHDTFDVSQSDDSATPRASAQVVAAVLGTLESAREGGHVLKAIGVTWSDHAEAAEVRDALAAHGIDDAMLVSELHAAGALAQTAGRAVGYDSTALLFLDRDTATLSVVRTDDGSVVKVLSRSLHSTDAMAVLTEMASAVAAQDSPPQGMFVVGSGVDVASVKSHLQDLVSMPVNAPEESGLALARGAALAAVNAPTFDASTVGLAYSQDPEGATAGTDFPGLAAASTGLHHDAALALSDEVDPPAEEGRKPFLLVGSALTSVFVIGVIALVISLAVSIRPTADQRPDPGQSAIIPNASAPVAPVPEMAQPPAPAPVAPAPAPAPEPAPAETIKAPVPVVQQERQTAPRKVFVEQPAAPAPQAAPDIPDPPAAPPAPIPDPAPAAVPPVPPVFTPPAPWQQYPQQYSQYPQYPQQQYPQYPPPQQYPQYPPQQQWPGGDGRYGRGGYGGGAPRVNCFLIFCAPAGR